MLGSIQNILRVSLPGAEGACPPSPLPSPQAAALAPGLPDPADLVGAVLGEQLASQPSLPGAVTYLVEAFQRQRQEEHSCGKRASVPPLSSVMQSTKQQLVTSLALLLRTRAEPSSSYSPLYSLLAEEQLPFDLTLSLVQLLTPDPAALSAVFSPLLQHCLTEARRHRHLTSPSYLQPLLALTFLTKLRLADGSRPLADLLPQQPQWVVASLSPAAGAEVAALTFLGPLLAPSVFPEEDPAVAEAYFKELPSSQGQQQQQVGLSLILWSIQLFLILQE